MISSAARLMREPIGILIRDEPPRSIHKLRRVYLDFELNYLASVGDIVTLNIIRYWRVPNIAIIDNKTLRDRKIDTLSAVSILFKDIIRLHNRPATITDKNIDTIETAVKLAEKGRNVLLVVDGEEDLLSILLILCLNRGLVVYGNYFTNSLIAIPTYTPYKVATLKLLAQFRYGETMG